MPSVPRLRWRVSADNHRVENSDHRDSAAAEAPHRTAIRATTATETARPMVPGGLGGERQLLRAGLRQGAASRSQKRLVPVRLARERQLLHPLMCPMKPTNKIRFTEPQIALVMRAHPNRNLDHLTELSFEFDDAGKIVDCIGTIKDGGNIDRDYTGSGLARLYEKARRQLVARQTSATILQFPDGERLGKCVA